MDSITNTFNGTVQLCRFNSEKKEAFIGRFLIGSDSDRGRGTGKAALKRLVEIGFGEFELESIKLNVFDFNDAAIRCYQAIGFTQNEFTENVYRSKDGLVWNNIEMMINRESF
ncbi:GNAT family N-acetyltransferase [Paenibacillus sp. PR3]|uniref:GNAT family N-acetyltransferase n=1 Tax=Paenibacillus terricola TaxID=2763503 RepID=A0ABR8N461_9BACL|nr:GNAT family N-acetyltransferase [Paenibacillus terricola]MBD3922962.1 GNAT family N-acetyltransferase [Paenibacillus terricola]